MDDRIGPMLETALHVYVDSTRQTGRTTRMIAEMQNGDTVVCPSYPVARSLVRLAFDTAGKKIKCVVVDPRQLDEHWTQIRGLAGNVLFEHTWIERYYLEQVKASADNLQWLRNQINNRLTAWEFGGDSNDLQP